MSIESKSQLSKYILRKLGNGVINIEVSTDQINDRISDTVDLFTEFHYDGVEEVFWRIIVHKQDEINKYITFSDLQVILKILSPTNNSSIEMFDNLDFLVARDLALNFSSGGVSNSSGLSAYAISREHYATLRYLLTPENSFNYNKLTEKLVPLQNFSSVGSGNLLSTDLNTWTTINAALNINSEAWVNGNLTGSTITSDGTGVSGIKNTYTTEGYVRGTRTINCLLKSGTYSGTVDIIAKDRSGQQIGKTKTVQPTSYWKEFYVEITNNNTHINDVEVFIQSSSTPTNGQTFFIKSPSLYYNNSLIVSGYKSVDPVEFGKMYNDKWFKSYSTELVRLQWGHNLGKYQNIQMAGGVSLNSDQIIQEAQQNIEKLENDLQEKYSEPIDFFIG